MNILSGGGSYKIDQATGALKYLRIPRPSNFHAHLRTGPLRAATARQTMLPWKYLLAMPNTGPIDTVTKMIEYHKELVALRDRFGFKTEFIMTVYLTKETTPAMIDRMVRLDMPCAVKYYPPHKGATTGSGFGIPLEDAHEVLAAMQSNGVRLLGHFESPYDKHGVELPHEQREDYAMMHLFPWLREKYHWLKITIEHATTEAAILQVVADPSGRTTCTITPQAMLQVRSELEGLSWGVHAKCMPIAKTPRDRNAVRGFALSADKRAYLGDDTAPHPSRAKLVPFGDAASGCYLPHSLALYADLFYRSGVVENFVKFACHNGPDAWGLPRPGPGEIVVLGEDSVNDIPVPASIPGENDVVIPFGWSAAGDAYHPGLSLTVPR
jgi:dihydroorotase